ncbi:MAG TPA: DUF2085 domain-containing protein, partial [Thermoanaerobaculia bacterium]|nr:DUF2085 domain-containing protein [Thermoanaerobaculia bacterium]
MTTARRFPHPVLIAGVALWLGAVLLAPLAAGADWRVAPWLYAAFHLVCHQIPERSFFLGEHALAVCHRCTGLYAGGLLGLLALPGLHRLRHWLTQQPKRMLWLMLPMLIDVALPWSTWWSRFATG